MSKSKCPTIKKMTEMRLHHKSLNIGSLYYVGEMSQRNTK